MRFIQLNQGEQQYGQKELLQSEISLLECMKHAKEYRRLRSEDLALKRDMVAKITQLGEKMRLLNTLLPHAQESASKATQPLMQNRKDLELEIDSLKEKLKLLSD